MSWVFSCSTCELIILHFYFSVIHNQNFNPLMPNVTKILRWFQPNNFWWKRNKMLIQNTYTIRYLVAFLESVARITTLDIDFSQFFLQNCNFHLLIFFVIAYLTISVSNGNKKYSNAVNHTSTEDTRSEKFFLESDNSTWRPCFLMSNYWLRWKLFE